MRARRSHVLRTRLRGESVLTLPDDGIHALESCAGAPRVVVAVEPKPPLD